MTMFLFIHVPDSLPVYCLPFSFDWDKAGCSTTMICSDEFGGSLSFDGPASEVSLCTWVGLDGICCERGIGADSWFVGI